MRYVNKIFYRCGQKINIVRLCRVYDWYKLMSIGTSKIFSGIQEAFILALMLVSVFAILYLNMSIIYKVGIVALAISMVFLMTLATQILREQKETAKRQQA